MTGEWTIPYRLRTGWKKNGEPKFHKGIFYAKDERTLKLLITIADCPPGDIVQKSDWHSRIFN